MGVALDGVVASPVIGPVAVDSMVVDPTLFILPAIVSMADAVIVLLEPDGPQTS